MGVLVECKDLDRQFKRIEVCSPSDGGCDIAYALGENHMIYRYLGPINYAEMLERLDGKNERYKIGYDEIWGPVIGYDEPIGDASNVIGRVNLGGREVIVSKANVEVLLHRGMCGLWTVVNDSRELDHFGELVPRKQVVL